MFTWYLSVVHMIRFLTLTVVYGYSFCARTQQVAQPCLPITPELLLKIKQSWEQQGTSKDRIMLWVAATLCLFSFLRSGEVCVPADCSFDEGAHLAFANVSVDSLLNPSSMRIRIKASKTDPFRQGVDIFVGQMGKVLCPVSAMLAYLEAQDNHPGPLFMFQDGKLLTRRQFVSGIQGALSTVGIDPSPYSGHSFRS